MRTQALFTALAAACLLICGCSAAGPGLIALEPTPVEYSDSPLSPRYSTLFRTDHQGFHEIRSARAYIDADGALTVIAEPPLPAYWLGMELYIKDGSFQARPNGTPFDPGKLRFEVTDQELILQNGPLLMGRVTSGCASIKFVQHEKGGQSGPYFFTGCFSAAMRPQGDDKAGAAEHLEFAASQELSRARRELGSPMCEARFTAGKADSFRAKALGSHISARTEVREVTWNVSPEASLGDGGKERLSVWYTRQGDQWFPVAHRIWTSGDPAYPSYLDKPAQ